MREHRHLNYKGKIALSILTILVLVLFVKVVGVNKTASSASKQTSAPAELLTLSFETKKEFSDSELDKSYKKKQQEAKERAQEKKREEQKEKQRKAEQNERAIYLTFDDGPSQDTGELLDILNQYQEKATFFMLGPQIQSYPEVVKKMVDEGFGLGLHGITHDAAQIYRSAEAPVEEMRDDQQIVEDVTGVHTKLVRLPYGSIPYLTEEMRGILDKEDFQIWDWNVDSRDWEFKDERYIQHTIQEIKNVEQTGETPIVLLHDKPETIRHLPKLLTYLQKEGYQTKTMTNEMVPFTFECEGRCYPING